ncbi:MAG TPA: glutathione S-transferase family protein [Polyangiaceae bacterium]|jgi:glutathione S-transferase
MRLYDIHGSPNCRKVRVVARELGLHLELLAVDFVQTKQPGYLAKNPTGKVPTLVDDDGTVVWESGAILVHLAEKDPEHRLLPVDPPVRSEVVRWMFFGATHLQPWLSLLGQERLLKARRGEVPDAAIVALAERELARFLPVLDDTLERRDYLARSFSIADVALGCGLEGAEARGVGFEGVPQVAAWRQRLRARPAWND